MPRNLTELTEFNGTILAAPALLFNRDLGCVSFHCDLLLPPQSRCAMCLLSQASRCARARNKCGTTCLPYLERTLVAIFAIVRFWLCTTTRPYFYGKSERMGGITTGSGPWAYTVDDTRYHTP